MIELVPHARGVRQPVHLPRVEAGDAGCRAQEQAGGGPGGDVARLGPGIPRDDLPRAGLQLRDVHTVLGGFAHGRRHLGCHQRATEPGGGAGSIDDCPHTEVRIHTSHRPPPYGTTPSLQLSEGRSEASHAGHRIVIDARVTPRRPARGCPGKLAGEVAVTRERAWGTASPRPDRPRTESRSGT